jgi:hypothetical protein
MICCSLCSSLSTAIKLCVPPIPLRLVSSPWRQAMPSTALAESDVLRLEVVATIPVEEEVRSSKVCWVEQVRSKVHPCPNHRAVPCNSNRTSESLTDNHVSPRHPGTPHRLEACRELRMPVMPIPDCYAHSSAHSTLHRNEHSRESIP